jgi:hypothetical protein
LWTICLGWPQTAILLISASHVAGITGISHGAWIPFTFKIFSGYRISCFFQHFEVVVFWMTLLDKKSAVILLYYVMCCPISPYPYSHSFSGFLFIFSF